MGWLSHFPCLLLCCFRCSANVGVLLPVPPAWRERRHKRCFMRRAYERVHCSHVSFHSSDLLVRNEYWIDLFSVVQARKSEQRISEMFIAVIIRPVSREEKSDMRYFDVSIQRVILVALQQLYKQCPVRCHSQLGRTSMLLARRRHYVTCQDFSIQRFTHVAAHCFNTWCLSLWYLNLCEAKTKTRNTIQFCEDPDGREKEQEQSKSDIPLISFHCHEKDYKLNRVVLVKSGKANIVSRF